MVSGQHIGVDETQKSMKSCGLDVVQCDMFTSAMELRSCALKTGKRAVKMKLLLAKYMSISIYKLCLFMQVVHSAPPQISSDLVIFFPICSIDLLSFVISTPFPLGCVCFHVPLCRHYNRPEFHLVLVKLPGWELRRPTTGANKAFAITMPARIICLVFYRRKN
ncbi:hypothetical protein EJB05_34572, partial [Eragrostis curvula]